MAKEYKIKIQNEHFENAKGNLNSRRLPWYILFCGLVHSATNYGPSKKSMTCDLLQLPKATTR